MKCLKSGKFYRNNYFVSGVFTTHNFIYGRGFLSLRTQTYLRLSFLSLFGGEKRSQAKVFLNTSQKKEGRIKIHTI